MEHVDYVTIKKVLDESDVGLVPKFDADTRKRHVFNRKVRVEGESSKRTLHFKDMYEMSVVEKQSWK
jgi:hypothetical protein